MGIIGCGEHAAHHARHYDGLFLTYGVWDPDPKAMEKFVGRKFDTLEALLGTSEIDAVMICSPDEYHLTQIELALEAGKHVFCEKPLLVPGEDIARLEAAFDLSEARDLVLTSCHPRRFDRPIRWLMERLLFNSADTTQFRTRFGRVLSFDFDFSYHVPSNEWKHERSLLLDHLNHEVDLMNALLGIEGFRAWKLHDSFDHYEVVGKRDDGITFCFRGTRRLKEHVYPEWCRVRFERGEVVLDMMLGVAHINDHNNKTSETVTDLHIDYEGRLWKVMANFHAQIAFDITVPYLNRMGMLMNAEAGIILQNEGVQRVDVRS